jgi:two-component system NtrC family sensor kinase
LETGADDYLVKPFAARELLARVRTQLELARARDLAEAAARELAETRAKLVQDLEQTNRELQGSYRELASTQAQLVHTAKMASLGQLVAGIAHEFNNPLAFLLGHLKTIERSLNALEPLLTNDAQGMAPTPHFRRARERAADIETGLTRIQELVQKLRAFSRLDEGELHRVSIQECVDGALILLRHRFSDRIELKTSFTGAGEIECDASLLNQALVNVLTNAIEAIEGPGVIEISSETDASQLTIRVSDTGRGVPAALRERVFEPFFTTKAIGQGTGLGLSITYSIVQKHGGSIELLPREGRGTEVVIRLPLRPAARVT